MSNKTKSQLEQELKEAQAEISRLERALKEGITAESSQMETRLRQVLEILPVGVSILDEQRNVVFQNSAFSQIVNINAEGIKAGIYKNRKYLSGDGSPMPPDGFASMQATLTGRAVHNIETGIINENGETIWSSVSAVPVDFPDWKTVVVTADLTERKLLEKKLRESEQRHTLLFQKSSIPVFLIKLPEVIIADTNEAAEKLVGYTREEVIGRNAAELGLISHAKRKETIEKFENERELAQNEMRIVTKSGEEHIIIVNTNPLDIGGQPFAITSMQDITERKHAEEKLRQSEERYKLISENAADVIWVMDPLAGKFTYISPSVEKLRGYTPEEVMAQPISEALTPESLKLVSESLQENLPAFIARGSGTMSFVNEVDQPCKDGSIVHTEVTTTYVINERGQVEIVGVSRDITDRKQEAERRQKSELLFRTLFELSPDAVILIDPHDPNISSSIVDCNTTACLMNGYHRDELVGQSIEILNAAPFSEEGRSAYLERLRREGPLKFEVLHRRKDGTIFPVETSTTIIQVNGRELLIGMDRDITERKRAEDELKLWGDIFHNVTWGFVVGGPEGKTLDLMNPAFARMHGYTEQELIGTPIADVFAPECRAELPEQIRIAHEKGQHTFESKHIRRDGTVFPVLVEVVTVKDNAGKSLYRVASVQDISERKLAEEQRAKLTERLDLATRSAHMGIWDWDIQKNEIIWDDEMYALYGLQPGDFGGAYEAWLHGVHPEDREPSNEVSAAAVRGEREYDTEFRVLWPDGSVHWLKANGQVFRDENGVPLRMVGVNYDITERKQADEDLREKEERFRILFETMVQGVLLQDTRGRTLLANPAAQRILDLNLDQIVGKGITHPKWIVVREDGSEYPEEERPTMAVLRTAKPVIGAILGITNPNSKVQKWLSINAVPRFRPGEKRPYQVFSTLEDITDRKHALEELIQQAETLREQAELIEHAHVLIRDLDNHIVLWNSSMEKLYGWTREQAIGQVTHIFFQTEFPVSLEAYQTELMQNGNWEGELTHTRKDGAKVAVISHQTLFRDRTGKPTLILEVNNDITGRKRAEDALRLSQENFARAFESNPAALAITRKSDGKFINVNDSYTSILGYSKAEIIGRNVTELSIYVNPNEREQLLRALTEQGKVVNHELTVRSKSREHRELLVSMEPTLYDTEKCILSTFIDITDRKRMEHELRTSEERLRLSLKAANQGLYDLNVQTGEAIVNDEYALMLGYNPADFHETNNFWIERLHPDDQEITAQAYKNYVEGRLPDYRVEFRQRTRSGEWKWILSLGKLVQWDEHGQPLRMLGTHTDINSRKLMENELRRSNAELEQFAYVASHDLQEPLRAVAGMVQLLQKRYQGQLDERADEYIGHAVEAAGRMQALIQALLTYSRVERRNQPIEAVDAGNCLRAAIKNLDVSIRENHAVITIGELPTVHADAVQLIQLFQNLIGNGIKFRGEREPQIHISATKLKDAWRFSVQDNGIGIESRYYERIFQIFQRLHTRREYSGTGIGLALCKKIIERHGGRIWVESEPGRGSTFHFTLPLRSQS